MKKTHLYILIIILLTAFIGCDDDQYYYHTAVNNSSRTVTVSFYRAKKEVELAPGESKKIALEKETNGKTGIKDYSPNKRVVASYSGSKGICNFKDRDSYTVSILNLTGKSGTLFADGWMDDISFSTSSSEQTNISWIIYTRTPNFTASLDDYPASVSFLPDGDGFKVTIGN